MHLPRDPDPALPEEIERSVAAEHREHHVVRKGLFPLALPFPFPLEHDLARADLLHPRAQAKLDRPRAAQETLERFEMLMLRARELPPAVHQGDLGPGLGERDRRLERGIAAADHQRLLPREVLGIVEPVVHLVEALPGDAEHPEVSAPSDRDEHAPRGEEPSTLEAHAQLRSVPLDPLGARRLGLDLRALGLSLQLLDQRLLHVGVHLEIARGLHGTRVGVDRLRLGEIHEGGKRLRRFENLESKSSLSRLDRRRHPRDSGSDDREVEDLRRRRTLPGICSLGGRGGRRLGPRVEGEFEERDSREIARNGHPGDVGGSVPVRARKRFHSARGPPRVKPARIACDPAKHEPSWRSK